MMKRTNFPHLKTVFESYRQQFRDMLSGNTPVPKMLLAGRTEREMQLERAQRAAELLLEVDLEQYARDLKFSEDWWQQIRPQHRAYAWCADDVLIGEDGVSVRPPSRESSTVPVPKLTFYMGASPQDSNAGDSEKYDNSTPENWWHEVQIDAFSMATCTVTRAQYRLFDPHREKDRLEGEYGFNSIAPDDDCPMIYVDWYDAFCFALWLGDKYQLPSEVEREGAAWGGINRPQLPDFVIGIAPYTSTFTTKEVNFNGNHSLDWKKSTYLMRTLPVRWDESRHGRAKQEQSSAAKLPHYHPNGFGLWHMQGNVFDWCRSAWKRSLQEAIDHHTKDIASSSPDGSRSIRGGSWADYAGYGRTSNRDGFVAGNRGKFLGFRLSRTQ
jgi:formylglycine-generating enzyme required for sulfatase activity